MLQWARLVSNQQTLKVFIAKQQTFSKAFLSFLQTNYHQGRSVSILSLAQTTCPDQIKPPNTSRNYI